MFPHLPTNGSGRQAFLWSEGAFDLKTEHSYCTTHVISKKNYL